jgi:hypothetical protein
MINKVTVYFSVTQTEGLRYNTFNYQATELNKLRIFPAITPPLLLLRLDVRLDCVSVMRG